VTEVAPNIRALVIQHEDDTPAGLIGEWLDGLEAAVDTLRIYADERTVDPRDYDLVVSLGSEFGAHDTHLPWLAREEQLLREAVERDVPVLGVCFGGQLLASALGGEAFRAPDWEIGWMNVHSDDPALISEGPWFQWHFDSFTLPPEATLLADSPAGPQAFVFGRSLGLQFHPEVTPAIMDQWVAVFRHELDATGVDPDRLLEQTRAIAPQSRARGLELFEAFRKWAGVAVVRR
jgi:GMP synthase-like glutamine amidotransferase